MSTTVQTKNQLSDQALQHIAAIEAARTEYEIAKKRDAESRQQLECAKAEVASILSDRNADLTVSVEALLVVDARVKILGHRLSGGADSRVSERLFELVAAVDEAQGLLFGASNYIAKTIRERKIKEIAFELDLPFGQISADEITVRLHPKATAAERLAMNRLSQSGDLEKVSERIALQHAAGVLLKLRQLADFAFEDDSVLSEPTENASDSATGSDT